jgi:hypothetical protein
MLENILFFARLPARQHGHFRKSDFHCCLIVEQIVDAYNLGTPACFVVALLALL